MAFIKSRKINTRLMERLGKIEEKLSRENYNIRLWALTFYGIVFEAIIGSALVLNYFNSLQFVDWIAVLQSTNQTQTIQFTNG
ncbi:MAG: hypothetical protein ACREBS_01915, partial [Nitrososphaerales archaeon]